MSRFTFLASDGELPEIDLSGVIKLTVKDLKEMNPRPESFWDLDKLPDDCEALFIPNEADTGGLEISICKNPPDGLEEYIKKKYIYWLSGNFDLKWANQFQEYLNNNIQESNSIEVWSIWFGWDEFEEFLYKDIELSKINSCDFELLGQRDCCFTIRRDLMRQLKKGHIDKYVL
ncbi:hypothetical protein [Desulfosporosinus sp. BG]|uniref:hypothetical protein n=1 Tax=Desulfosporosinus sp. BG TaxID=1633135 RepID=UPI00083A8579|nr:hypothetical protein [Desulfosporosinus sp. BG]